MFVTASILKLGWLAVNELLLFLLIYTRIKVSLIYYAIFLALSVVVLEIILKVFKSNG